MKTWLISYEGTSYDYEPNCKITSCETKGMELTPSNPAVFVTERNMNCAHKGMKFATEWPTEHTRITRINVILSCIQLELSEDEIELFEAWT